MNPGMLTIRQKQMELLEESGLCRWICDYLRAAYPRQTVGIKETELTATVKNRFRQARQKGFRESSEIRKYVHVAFLLGDGFPQNAHFQWARKILENPDFRHEGARLRALEDATARFFDSKEAARE
jgi:hypothetical protein